MKRYEGLFILNTAGKEEGLKETIDKLSTEISSAGGSVETVQKMERKNFIRVADKKHSSGYYVNVIFSLEPTAVNPLKAKFSLNEEVFRVLFTEAATPKAAK